MTDQFLEGQTADSRNAIWVLVSLLFTIIFIFGFFYYGVPLMRHQSLSSSLTQAPAQINLPLH